MLGPLTTSMNIYRQDCSKSEKVAAPVGVAVPVGAKKTLVCCYPLLALRHFSLPLSPFNRFHMAPEGSYDANMLRDNFFTPHKCQKQTVYNFLLFLQFTFTPFLVV